MPVGGCCQHSEGNANRIAASPEPFGCSPCQARKRDVRRPETPRFLTGCGLAYTCQAGEPTSVVQFSSRCRGCPRRFRCILGVAALLPSGAIPGQYGIDHCALVHVDDCFVKNLQSLPLKLEGAVHAWSSEVLASLSCGPWSAEILPDQDGIADESGVLDRRADNLRRHFDLQSRTLSIH